MITKGKIISKILNTNKYSVYIPYFSDAGKKEQYVEATLMQDPAINESFLQGDIVFIGFEDGLAAKPVILGKLYLADGSESRGYANLEQLNVKYKAELPEDTTIGNTNFNDVLSSILEKQDKLIAGENITIRDNIISATGGGSSGSYVRYDTSSQGLTNTEKSNARTNIGAGTSNFSGDYDDLTNKPSIPSKTSDITNDSGFITASDIPTIPTKTSQLVNDSGYITNAYHDSTKANQSEVNIIQAKIPSAASSSNQLADKAFVNSSIETATATFRGTFEALIARYNIQLEEGDTATAYEPWVDPEAEAVYYDVALKPEIPTKTSELTNDSGFISNTSELENILSTISGYNSTKTQTLKNINGTFMWVDDNS